MMRLRVASAVLMASCGLVALCVAGASLAQVAVAGATASSRPWRLSSLSVAPAPDDLALVEIEFPRAHGSQAISRRTLALTLGTPIGSDYLVVVTPSFRPTRSPRAFVLIVNRPSPLFDPARIPLRMQTARALGSPRLWSLANPFSHRPVGLTPALCHMPLHGASTLRASALRTLRSQGPALTGFSPAATVAEAYDVACGLPSEAAFARALGRSSEGECSSVRALCCPPNAVCATARRAPAGSH
ncbi:MAG TPA: hypothetical protein VHT29_00115 [Solirubrobacteraceae bacterium]|jgi:hypothetical protein|nr:hypothetical protein [Solirubrobacteraceae bacterium]